MNKPLGHVLVVDDNRDCAESLALLIEMEGFSVATAMSLAQARAQLRERPPRLVFLDVGFPDGNGLELLEQARGIPGLDVVMLTGSGDSHDKELALQLGAVGYLIKPTELGSVQAMLARLR